MWTVLCLRIVVLCFFNLLLLLLFNNIAQSHAYLFTQSDTKSFKDNSDVIFTSAVISKTLLKVAIWVCILTIHVVIAVHILYYLDNSSSHFSFFQG